jgi:hypothetical protein
LLFWQSIFINAIFNIYFTIRFIYYLLIY